MFLELSDMHATRTSICFSAVIRSEDGDPSGRPADERPFIYKGHFDDHVAPRPRARAARPLDQEGPDRGGLGLRHHLPQGQGSQWQNVIVFDDGLGRTAEDRARWLYTAITRAERGLVILD